MEEILSVFLAEDEFVVREGIKNNIDWASHNFEFCGEAGDGEVALSMIRDSRPDIVITDIKMPFMDGLTLSRHIREEFPETEIVLLTGYEEFSYAKEALEIGIARYLSKPIDGKSLLRELDTVAAKIRARREAIATAEKTAEELEELKAYKRRYTEKLRELLDDVPLPAAPAPAPVPEAPAGTQTTPVPDGAEDETAAYRDAVQEAIRYIAAHYAEEELSLQQLAAHVGFSPNHFSALFRQETGQTFIRYLTDYRMKLARKLLRETDKRSSEIAILVGYRDPHYFSYLFGKTQGVTPTQYRDGQNA